MKKIVKIRTDNNGKIEEVMFEDKNVVSVSEAITMAYNGEIDDVSVGKAKDGTEFIRSNPNNCEDDNLKSLPRF